MIKVHPSARISNLADIEDSIRGTKIIIGENSVIDSFVKIKPAGGHGDLEIGARCTVNSGCVFYTGNGIAISDDVLIAANCTFAPTNHEFKDKSRPIREQGFKQSRGGIIVETDVWIGANCVILDGAKIGRGCVVAAGSVVKGQLDAYTIYGGTPLRVLGTRS